MRGLMPEHATHRNVTFRLLPGSVEAAQLLLGTARAARYTWNEIKEARELQFEHAAGRAIERPTFFTLGKAFKALWDRETWLHEYSYDIVRYTLKDQADAWKAFFEGRSGYPKWKNRHQAPAFTIPDKVRIRDGRLAVPKVGWLELHRRGGNPYPDGKPVQARVRRAGRRWYAVVCFEVNREHTVHNGHVLGVDRNVRQVADSDGEIHRMPDLERLNAKVRRHQRALSRKKKGSNRRKKAVRKVARAARRLANARKAWLHRTSRRLADKAGTVVIEKLDTATMTRSAKGTKDAPGTNVRAKAGLNREILHTGWGAMERMLEYKALELIRVPAAYTSQTCSACGVIDADSRRTQASFKCVACGHAQNADLNAARNILASATGATARRGAFTLVTPVTREMDTAISLG